MNSFNFMDIKDLIIKTKERGFIRDNEINSLINFLRKGQCVYTRDYYLINMYIKGLLDTEKDICDELRNILQNTKIPPLY